MDRNYFHHFSENDANPGTLSEHPDKYSEQRFSQFWYLNPVNNMYKDDYLFIKALFTCLPGLFAFYYYYAFPRNCKRTFGTTGNFKRCVKY